MPYGEVSITAVFEKHSGGKATCTAPAVCDICEQPYGEADPNGHALTHCSSRPATSTEDGNIEF